MIDVVRLTFAALREAGPTHADELSIRALPQAPRGVALGIDGRRRSHLLIPESRDHVVLRGTAAIGVSHRPLEISGEVSSYVDVACEIAGLSEAFDHFVVAVVDALGRSPAPASSVVAETLEHWKRLLTTTGTAPSQDRLASVFGELLVLIDLVDADPDRRVDAWVGPSGARHDIRRGRFAIEVKTTRAHGARVVMIHGEDQLLPPEDGALHLHFVRLEESPGGGRSVPDLVDALLNAGAPASALFDRLAAAGLLPAHFRSASELRFDVRERFTIPIGDDFPRIVPASFVGGQRPAGVLDLSYRIDLDQVRDRLLSDAGHQELLRRMATEGAH